MSTPRFSLAQLAAAQQSNFILAHSLGESAQQVADLRRAYARKRTEWETLRTLMSETAPDLVVRTADGRELVLRLPSDEAIHICCLLSETLTKGLSAMEQQIVRQLLEIERDTSNYDTQQAASDTELMAPLILALCAPGDPALATPTLPSSEWLRRTEAAEDLEEAMQQEHGVKGAYGREILWHPLFPAEYVACVSKMPLYEVIEFHEALPGWCNQRRPLDTHDLSYLTDVLREELASQPTDLVALRLSRALAWVEQAGTAPAQPAQTRPQTDTLPLLAGVTTSAPQFAEQALAA